MTPEQKAYFDEVDRATNILRAAMEQCRNAGLQPISVAGAMLNAMYALLVQTDEPEQSLALMEKAIQELRKGLARPEA